jgi:hypothetical protein
MFGNEGKSLRFIGDFDKYSFNLIGNNYE